MRWLLGVLCAATLISHCLVAAANPEGDVASVTAERHIPFKSGEAVGTGTTVLRVAAGLAVVLVIGIVGLILLRKYVPNLGSSTAPGSSKVIELIELRRLTPRLTLFLVDVQGVRYLFAQSGDRVVSLTTTPPKS
jgi:flagellar biogenesis protein FliO